MALNVLHEDYGDLDADIVSHDTYVRSVPHAAFAHLRETDPVAWIDEPGGNGFWAVLKHKDLITVSKDWERFTVSKGIRLEEMDSEELHHRRTMMEFDPPEHARLRRLVQKGFTPKVVANYEIAFRVLVNEVLDRVLIDDEFDFVTEISRELPISLLCKLLGVDQADAGKLVSWGDRMISNADPEYADFVIDKDDTEEYRLLPFRSPAALEVFSYAEKAALQRRQESRDDIISNLLAPDKDGKPLTDLEFKNFFSLLMVAGNETTRHTITHGLMMMMNHPDQWSAFRNDPSGMSKLATEEILRASSVTMHFRRTATVDTELGGKEIRAGDKVVMWYISADYDEDAFKDPFVFDITRDEGDVLAFGVGRHICLGAHLARLEVKVMFEELAHRVERFQILGQPDRLRSNFINGIKHLPVRAVLAAG